MSRRWTRSRATPSIVVRIGSIIKTLGGSESDGLSIDEAIGRLEEAVRTSESDRLALSSEVRFLEAAIDALAHAAVVLARNSLGELRPVATLNATNAIVGGASSAVPMEEVIQFAKQVRDAPMSTIVYSFGPPQRTFELTAVPVTSPNRDGVVLTVTDVSSRASSEEVRRDLVTNISHELRTPVGAIALLAETMADETDPSTLKRFAGLIEAEAFRLSSMVNGVLSLSRLETDESHEKEFIDVVSLVRAAIEHVEPLARVAGLRLELEVDPLVAQSDTGVVGDRSLLQRALENVLGNAVTYSDKGHPILIRVSTETSDERSDVRVDVNDRGIGIPLRERKRIFERFYRVDRSRTRDSGGSGIGLAIVRHIMVNHDGSIEVDSIEGEGSTFSLRLPAVARKS